MESQQETASALILLIFLGCGFTDGNSVSFISSSRGQVGKSLELICQLVPSGAYNLWKVNWYLNNSTTAIVRNAYNCDPLLSPSEYDLSRYTFSCNANVFILTIHELSQTDDGNCWSCSVVFEDTPGTDKASTCIIIGHITLESNNKVPTQMNSLELSCHMDITTETKYTMYWFSPSATSEPDGTCYIQQNKCTGGSSTHIFKVDEFGSYMNITRLNRRHDQGQWRCQYNGEISNLSVIVHTIPEGLSITEEGGTDLSMASTVLRCRTNSCTYPAPVIQWLYRDQSASSPYEVYITDNPTGAVESCEEPEQIYTSTLDLKQNTTLNDNRDRTLVFSCRITYLDSSRNLVASESRTIRFAVKVTEAVLKHDNQNSTGTANVTSGLSATFTCIIGTCRPAATIDWYIGLEKKGSGSSMTFVPNNADHDKTIYCQAYNTDASQPVFSQKPKLYVKVRVIEAVLQYNNQNITDTVNVTSGLNATLTCITGISRPTATIDWYIGTQKKGNGLSLTFIPSKDDHDKIIYCQAYNTDPSQPVSSQKAILFVKDCEDIVYIQPYPVAKAEGGDSLTLTCSHKCFNNPLTVLWYKNNAPPMSVFITSCSVTPEQYYEITRYNFTCADTYTLTIMQTTLADDKDNWGCSFGIEDFPSPAVKRTIISISTTTATTGKTTATDVNVIAPAITVPIVSLIVVAVVVLIYLWRQQKLCF